MCCGGCLQYGIKCLMCVCVICVVNSCFGVLTIFCLTSWYCCSHNWQLHVFAKQSKSISYSFAGRDHPGINSLTLQTCQVTKHHVALLC